MSRLLAECQATELLPRHLSCAPSPSLSTSLSHQPVRREVVAPLLHENGAPPHKHDVHAAAGVGGLQAGVYEWGGGRG